MFFETRLLVDVKGNTLWKEKDVKNIDQDQNEVTYDSCRNTKQHASNRKSIFYDFGK